MSDMIYPRLLQKEIVKFLDEEISIVIHGPRQSGKTHLLYSLQNYLEKQNQQTIYFDLEDSGLLNEMDQGLDSFLLLLRNRGWNQKDKIYVFIDEVQYLNNPSSLIKLVTDHYKTIHLILSGSSSFNIKRKFKDSLVGRIVEFVLYPLSFAEFLTFKQLKIDLSIPKTDYNHHQLKILYQEFVQFGAYPQIVLAPTPDLKRKYLYQIIDTYIRKDIRDLGGIEDINKFNSLLALLAFQTGQILNNSRLSKELSISLPTINKYLSVLEETYILRRIPPFSHNPHVELIKNPKIFFYDSGLAALLGLHDFPQVISGHLLETAVFSQLVKNSDRVQDIHFWRTKTGQEIDFVLEEKCITPMEVKTNFVQFEKGAMASFSRQYNPKDYKVIAISGQKFSSHCFFPWEI